MLCEEAGVKYQLIFTGLEFDEIQKMIIFLTNACGKLKYMFPSVMEMVDIGGGAEIDKNLYSKQLNFAYCRKKGFYRPTTLHVSPDGKVRTCMYAVGLNDCGSLRQMTMLEIVNNFSNRHNSDLFSDPIKYENAEKELFLPYKHYYHSIIHECTRFAIIARTAEMKTKYPEMSMTEIHSIISQSM
jgi:hypothetical protein